MHNALTVIFYDSQVWIESITNLAGAITVQVSLK